MKNKVEIAIVILVLLVVGLACTGTDDGPENLNTTRPTPAAKTQNTVVGEWLYDGGRGKGRLVISGGGASLQGKMKFPKLGTGELGEFEPLYDVTFDGTILRFTIKYDNPKAYHPYYEHHYQAELMGDRLQGGTVTLALPKSEDRKEIGKWSATKIDAVK